MVIDLTWMLYLALGIELFLAGICLVVGYFVLRQISRLLRTFMSSWRKNHERRDWDGPVQDSHYPKKA